MRHSKHCECMKCAIERQDQDGWLEAESYRTETSLLSAYEQVYGGGVWSVLYRVHQDNGKVHTGVMPVDVWNKQVVKRRVKR